MERRTELTLNRYNIIVNFLTEPGITGRTPYLLKRSLKNISHGIFTLELATTV
ncbi:hypothetical protein [Candidatus Kuenenia sp.]|uniref:hypothetical protein n=1 Tax=Candidatus Kuenenia sp. TaxID=2499824 RepID=UPI00322076E0